MNISELRNFLGVCKYKNFSKAAEYMFISQPTLSRQIADLEDEFGVQLFDRKNRSIELTAAGEVLYSEARKIIEACDMLPELVKKADSSKQGTLRIGYMGTVDQDIILEPIRSFSEKYPYVNVTMQKTMLSELNDFLVGDQCDIIYSVKIGVSQIKQLKYVKVARNRLKLTVPLSHPLAKKDSVSVNELEGENFVLFERNVSPYTVDAILAMCNNAGFSPKVVYYVRDPQTMAYFVAMGKGIAFLSERMQAHSAAGVKFLDIEDADLDFDIVVAWKKENDNPQIKKYLGEVLRYVEI